MLKENHATRKISWPEGRRVTVAITFDFQGGEPVRPLANGKMNAEDYAEGEYGPKTGIWRILRVLDEVKVKTTFLTCGGIAERYPEAMKAIAQQGHEIAGHGYHHEIARDLSREEEKEVIRRTTDMLMKRTGKQPVGWRTCTQSPNTIELLMEEGYIWNSNSFADDLPFIWDNGKSTLVELPRQPFGDGRLYGHENRAGDHPDHALVLWKRFFDELYRESALSPTFTTFQLHPYVSSRLGRASALREIIEYMQSHQGVWFATGIEVAEWWLKQGFSSEQPDRLRVAAGL
jgi:peptidoglycan/xylan/chitin deacetylase (PgdA/CDA1 family)